MEVTPYMAQGERYPSLIGVKADGDEHELAYVSKHELIKALEERDRLQSENAKLRELAATMLTCIDSGRDRDCWECPAHMQFDDLRWFCTIRHMCAEIGIMGVVADGRMETVADV